MATERSRRVAHRFLFRNGTITGFVDELAIAGVDIEILDRKRVARVCPSNPVLRKLFLAIRSFVDDGSALAEWTRRWPVAWSICAKGRAVGRFRNRAEAIRVEKRLFAKRAIDKMARKDYIKEKS